MKKAGLVTFFDAPNYGAVLQAYGLQHALEALGWSAAFLRDGRRPDGAAGAADRRQRVLEALRRRQREVLGPVRKPFAGFAERYFRTDTADGVRDLNAEYDLFIAGSDQVWNPEITGLNPFWLLDFADREKRFSYAASFGTDRLPEDCRAWYGERLAGFAGLSVREAAGRDLVRELTGREAALCPDPALLPGRDVWEALMTPMGQKSVMLYMTEEDAELERYARDEAAAKGLPLAAWRLNRPADGENDRSPEAWLGCLAGAGAVYTNSFHATVFAHLFHRELRIRPLGRMKNRNGRLFEFIAAMGETPAEDADRPGLYRPEGAVWAETDARLDALRRRGLDALRSITGRREPPA